MNKDEILKQIEIIFQDVLDNEDIVLSENTTAQDVDEWDSLTHIQLVVAIEKHFKVKFPSNVMLSWKNAGEIVDSVISRIS